MCSRTSAVLLTLASALAGAAAFRQCPAAPGMHSARASTRPPSVALRCSAEAGCASRRSVLAAAGAAAAGVVLGAPREVPAFDNRVAAKGKYPPSPGAKPKGVGEGPKDGQLKFCTGQPNCFTSSASAEDDAEHFFPPFEYTGLSKKEAMATLLEVVNAYKPGQGGIDEGGFKVIKTTDDYIYAQFESGKRGYVDDFELAMVDDGKVLVRSSSRLGYLDFGVNAKRINYIAAQLNEYEGWSCSKISKSSHPDYVAQNSGKEKDVPQQGTWLTE